MKRVPLATWLSCIAGLALVAVACGSASVAPGGDMKSPEVVGSPLPAEARRESFPEGEVRIGISLLDVGLLKGGAEAEAKRGWRVIDLKVTAVGPKGLEWAVLEFPSGVGSVNASDFFEVAVQELPRGEQIEVRASATFEDGEGTQVERSVVDRWPP